MTKLSYSSVSFLAHAGAGVKLSALDYDTGEISTIANALEKESFLIITDAAHVRAGALINIISQHEKNVILDFT